jgi:cytosine/adenosine deaminase-related metal-dependent hydrolase
MHYGHTNPRSHLFLDQAAMGVDTHFTYSTDILTQTRIWLQTVRYRFYNAILELWRIPPNNPASATQGFLLATRHGGLALRRPDLGIIAPGAKADIVVFDGMTPALLGWVDPVAAVILHASVADIEHVLVDGKFVKRDFKLTFKDYAGLQTRFLKSARRIQEIYRNTPLPVVAGDDFVSGFPYGIATTADALRGPGTGYGEVYV